MTTDGLVIPPSCRDVVFARCNGSLIHHNFPDAPHPALIICAYITRDPIFISHNTGTGSPPPYFPCGRKYVFCFPLSV
ncbi:hypothetical protein KCP73_02160 [Salmonella enterica subsp. enterica]|nr:hypothetical protein KCP73_02160 [Salmonella enterica subsp. enterica]